MHSVRWTKVDGAAVTRRMASKVTKKPAVKKFKETTRVVEYQGLQDQVEKIYEQMDDLWYKMTESERDHVDPRV